MPAKTVSAALAETAKQSSPGALIAEYEGDFARVLPSHIRPETFVRLSQGLLRRDPRLRAAAVANPGSFLAALLDCARLGHEPGTDQFALVAFKDKRTGYEIVGIEQYRGVIERMYRAGAVKSVLAEVVRHNDLFEKGSRPPEHVPAYYATHPHGSHRHPWFASKEDRGELVGVYAYAVFADGTLSRVVALNRDEVMQHKARSRGADSPDSPWQQWEERMWLKTAVHVLEPWVPTSAEYERTRLRAAAEAARVVDATPDEPPVGGVIDGDVVDSDAVVDDEPQQRGEVEGA